jgi:hypothetical protein
MITSLVPKYDLYSSLLTVDNAVGGRPVAIFSYDYNGEKHQGEAIVDPKIDG